MTQTTTADTADTAAAELQCMEIIGGNAHGQRALSSPGLDIWVDSRPHRGDHGGGDIHYFSLCGGGHVARLALADISGHGKTVHDVAQTLRKLMRKHINQLDQTRFARRINREFSAVSSHGRFATAVLATYFAPTNNLILVNAGHPRPLWYSTRDRTWRLLDDRMESPGPSIRQEKARYHLKRISNLPLGVIKPTEYSQFAIKLDRGDLVMIYTDALIEAANGDGKLLGEQGLLEVTRDLDPGDPATIGDRLLDGVARYRGRAEADDDQTLIVLHQNGGKPPRMTLSLAMRSLAKMIGLSKV